MLLLVFCLISLASAGVVYAPDDIVMNLLQSQGFLTPYIEEGHLDNDIIEADERSINQVNDKIAGLRFAFDEVTKPLPVVFDREIISRRLKNSRTVLNYLNDFGYLDAYLNSRSKKRRDEATDMGRATMMDMMDIEGALKLFQTMNHLHSTGMVDIDVLELMKIPRCGVPDIDPNYFSIHHGELKSEQPREEDGYVISMFSMMNMGNGALHRLEEQQAQGDDYVIAREKRFEISDEKWPKPRLAFYIENVSDTLDQFTKIEIVRAFEVWTDHVALNLYEVTDVRVADIRIKFVTKYHGDKYPFDGALGVLAHAFYPRSGEVHFDNDEEFTRNTERGVNLYYTAAHEFGHTFGLKHSLNRESLMSPYHPGLQDNIELHADDLAGIAQLYQGGIGAVYTSDHPDAIEFQRELLQSLNTSQDFLPHAGDTSCIGHIDAVMHHPSTKTLFFFTGDVYYKVERNRHGEVGVIEGYPKFTSIGWDGLEGDLDSAFVNSSISAAYFFKGEHYWKYDFDEETMYPGYPKKISPKIPKNLKATMSSGQMTYFFASPGAWKHDRTSDHLQAIEGGNVEVDAAFPLFVKGYFATTHGKTYSIYKVKNMEEMQVYHGRPLSWDYGLPMCSEDLITVHFNPKMKTLCDAYALIAFNDIELDIPEDCYELLEPFPAKSLQEIID